MTQRFKRALRLMDSSPIHRNWSLQGKIMAIVPPLMHDQCIVNGNGFLSWAWLSDESVKAFLSRGYLQPEEWRTGNHLWMVDMIGNARKLMADAINRDWTNEDWGRFRQTGNLCRWRRTFGTGKTVKIGWAKIGADRHEST